jgi:hypothetical protein
MAQTSTRLDQIEASMRHMLRDLHRNVPVSNSNRERLLILAGDLKLHGEQLRDKVMRSNKHRFPPPVNDNGKAPKSA